MSTDVGFSQNRIRINENAVPVEATCLISFYRSVLFLPGISSLALMLI